MAARRSLPVLITLAVCAGCSEEDTQVEDTGFRVAAVVPVDGDEAAVESTNPELRVSAFADPTTCTEETVRLVAVDEGNTVVRELRYSLSFPDNGRKIRLDHTDPLARGYWYMITVRSGTWGCTDTDQRMIRPFASSFYVP
ncbi:MAG: Ig-like domain-containing protein [Pseudomonadota bacterium]